MHTVRKKLAVINRKALSITLNNIAMHEAHDKWQGLLVQELKQAHQAGWDEVKRRFFEDGDKGIVCAHTLSYLMDQLMRTLYDFVTEHVYPLANPTSGERLCLVATGGYGRGELAPFSDIDLLFLIPYKANPWAENVAEYMLYTLWDLGLKVGHATRTPNECVHLAKEDLTIQTSLLESRYIWGDATLFKKAAARFYKRVVSGSSQKFIEQKLEERDLRHTKMGNTRYVVEPNIKDGKGGLRDLQTLWWIARHLYGINRANTNQPNILTPAENRQFQKSESFLWTVRVAIHFLSNRADERLTFDMQRRLSEALQYKDRPSARGVERFMKHYFLVAKQVGDLTRIFCAVLEAREQKSFFSLLRPTKKLRGFGIESGRLVALNESDFAENPGLMMKIFAVADHKNLDIHPATLRLIKQNLSKITRSVRTDPEANRYFLEVLTSTKDGEINLRRMNEAGVFGRFLPDFGRVVAQMQYDMYHHYTVDEHTIRAIGLISKIEAGTLADDHPLSTDVIQKVLSRNVLYVAVLLHDIAKGRGGDHSLLGAEVAERICPRLGLKAPETETVAWLVRWHLLMSNTAFKRDLSDPKTIQDFCDIVKSPERLRLLLLLTVVDIRAVGPGVWNGWKGQLLRELYYAAESVLMAGHATIGRNERVKYKKETLATSLGGWSHATIKKHQARMGDAYWIAEDDDTLLQNAHLMADTDKAEQPIGIAVRVEEQQSMTNVALYVQDHPGLIARIVGALGVASASVMSAKIHTSRDGMAMDNFIVQDMNGETLDGSHQIAALEHSILETLRGKTRPKQRLGKKRIFGNKDSAFKVAPAVLIDNKASGRSTVIEINAKDRPGLLYDLTYALYGLKISIISAHVATYGERAVDVFYVQDLLGGKITNKVRMRNVEEKLLRAVRGEPIFGAPKPKKKTTSQQTGSAA
ncbi:[protein-PII] uridylyltransferase [Kordiimonas aquimaris]|uniref:[protein-PII] uridylyltransferase n=1 Tax=Kordiimonas aquimaris TaxID=707591 RepID=UPI0021CE2C54|nr:[protein-PII] uridylyltransferase [Kordiimonas aquimaris]